MSLLIAPIEALTDPLLTDPERRVLLSLFSFRGKDTNTVWPSITAIAERANITDQTRVSKLTASLASKGWLTKRKKGFTGCNEYTLTVPGEDAVEVVPTSRGLMDEPSTSARKAMKLYLVTDGEACKVGITTMPMVKRLGALQTSSHKPLRVLFCIECRDAKEREEAILEDFSAHIISGEWLKLSGIQISRLADHQLSLPNLDWYTNLDHEAKLGDNTKSNLDCETNSNLDPDAKYKEQTNEQTNEQKKHIALEQQFKSIMASYPKREGSNSPTKAFASFKSRLAEGCKIEDMAAGVARYLLFCQLKGWIKTGYVMQASRFFGPGKEFENDWEVSNASSSRVTSGHSTGSVTEQSTVGKAAAAAARKRQEILARHGRGPGTGDGGPVGADGGTVRGEVVEAVR